MMQSTGEVVLIFLLCINGGIDRQAIVVKYETDLSPIDFSTAELNRNDRFIRA
jgi:hypothetical protein